MAKKKKDKDKKKSPETEIDESGKNLNTAELKSLINTLESKSVDFLPKLNIQKNEEEVEEDIDPEFKQVDTPSFLKKEEKETEDTIESPILEATTSEPSLPNGTPPMPPAPPGAPPPAPGLPPSPPPMPPAPQGTPDSESILPTNEEIVEESIPEVPADKYAPTGNLYGDIGVFMTELIDSYSYRYDAWEDSTNILLGMFRKMQLVNKTNSELLIDSISDMHQDIKDGLENFKNKRDFIEKYAETDYNAVVGMLKKTLELLALQLKEFKLKKLVNQLIDIYSK